MNDDVYNKILVGLIIVLLVVNLIVNIAYLNKKSDEEKTENYCGCNSAFPNVPFSPTPQPQNLELLLGTWKNKTGDTLVFNKPPAKSMHNSDDMTYKIVSSTHPLSGIIDNSVNFYVDYLDGDNSYALYIVDPSRGIVEYTKVI